MKINRFPYCLLISENCVLASLVYIDDRVLENSLGDEDVKSRAQAAAAKQRGAEMSSKLIPPKPGAIR